MKAEHEKRMQELNDGIALVTEKMLAFRESIVCLECKGEGYMPTGRTARGGLAIEMATCKECGGSGGI